MTKHVRAVVAAAVVVIVVGVGAAAALLTSSTSPSPRSHTSPAPTADPGVPGDVADRDGNGCQGEAECFVRTLLDDVVDDPQATIARYEEAAAERPLLAVGCHAAFHELGREVGRSADDPWDAMMAGTDGCNFGFVHGVVEGIMEAAFVDGAEPEQRLGELCTPDLSDSDADVVALADNCRHGAGHALLRAVDVPAEALERCLVAFDGSDVSECADGVFMEYANAPTRYRSEVEPAELCLVVDDDMKGSCWSNIGTVWLADGGGVVDAFDGCEAAGEWVELCARNVGTLSVFVTLSSPEGSTAATYASCHTFTGPLAAGCYQGVTTGLWSSAAQGAASLDEARALLDSEVPEQHRAGVDDQLDRALAGLPASQRPQR